MLKDTVKNTMKDTTKDALRDTPLNADMNIKIIGAGPFARQGIEAYQLPFPLTRLYIQKTYDPEQKKDVALPGYHDFAHVLSE